MPFNKTKFKLLIDESKISQCQLARDTGVDVATLCRLRSGKTKNPRMEVIGKIADYFKISMDEFRIKK